MPVSTRTRIESGAPFIVAGLLCLLIVGLQAFGEPLRSVLRYERQGIFAGEHVFLLMQIRHKPH